MPSRRDVERNRGRGQTNRGQFGYARDHATAEQADDRLAALGATDDAAPALFIEPGTDVDELIDEARDRGDLTYLRTVVNAAANDSDWQNRMAAYETGLVAPNVTEAAASDPDRMVRATIARRAGEWHHWFSNDTDPVVRHQARLNPYCPADIAARLDADPEVHRLSILVGAAPHDAAD